MQRLNKEIDKKILPVLIVKVDFQKPHNMACN